MTGEAKTAKMKVCLVGDEGVGKSSLIRRFVYSEFDEDYVKTVGTVVRKKEVELPEKGIKAMLMIWDIMGRRDFMDIFKDAYSTQTRG
jgi:small GTP-binding protein